MIYTITANPAIDCAIECDMIDWGETNYYRNAYSLIGGKGINVAIVLNRLKPASVSATGFLGKANSHVFETGFKNENLKADFVYYEGETRTNYKIKDFGQHQETELNGLGTTVSADKAEELLAYLRKVLKADDLVIAGGSLPRGIETNFYQEIGEICQAKHTTYFLDTSKEAMAKALVTRPALIKPNMAEIAQVLNQPLKTHYELRDIEGMVKQLQAMGATNVLVSMGGDGSLYFGQDGQIFKVGIAKGKLVNSVGAGDSMLAGVAYGFSQNMPLAKTLQYGAAAGAATAFSPWLGTKQQIEGYVNGIHVEQLK